MTHCPTCGSTAGTFGNKVSQGENMSKKPEQWAVKQHLEKYPKCEWICLHTKLRNLGEEMEERMQVYKPSTELFYVIESDGDTWFAHYNTFTNVQESDEVAFGKTPQEALQKFIDRRLGANK